MQKIWEFKCVECSKDKEDLKKHRITGTNYSWNSKCLSCGHKIKKFMYFDCCGNCLPKSRQYYSYEFKCWLKIPECDSVLTPQTIGRTPSHTQSLSSCRGVKESLEGHKCLCCGRNIVFTRDN